MITLVLLFLLVRAVMGRRGEIFARAGPLVYLFFFLLIAYSLSTGNAGTGFRYRTHLAGGRALPDRGPAGVANAAGGAARGLRAAARDAARAAACRPRNDRAPEPSDGQALELGEQQRSELVGLAALGLDHDRVIGAREIARIT